MAILTINIHGHSYQMACGDGEEEYLSELAKDLDKRTNIVGQHSKDISPRVLLVMTALSILDEMKEMESTTTEKIKSEKMKIEKMKIRTPQIKDIESAVAKDMKKGLDLLENKLQLIINKASSF